MDHATEQKLDHYANLAAMQQAARSRLDAGTFSDYPARPAADDQ